MNDEKSAHHVGNYVNLPLCRFDALTLASTPLQTICSHALCFLLRSFWFASLPRLAPANTVLRYSDISPHSLHRSLLVRLSHSSSSGLGAWKNNCSP
jgi:hypothetical protein